MIFINKIFASYLIVFFVFLNSLLCENQVRIDDPLVIKQQTDDALALFSLVDQWKQTIEKYSQKNDIEIKCKNCAESVLSLGVFDGYMLGWAIKAIANGHDEFEKIKTLLDKYIKLLSNDVFADELMNFMLNTSNDMNLVCAYCQEICWKR